VSGEDTGYLLEHGIVVIYYQYFLQEFPLFIKKKYLGLRYLSPQRNLE
jgi:hypothetical protein